MRFREKLLYIILFVGFTLAFTACGYGGQQNVGYQGPACQGDVTLHVVNDHSADIRVHLPGVTRRLVARGLKTTAFTVPRSRLRYDMALTVARGGQQIGGPEIVDGGTVECRDATLHIGTALWNSFFFGVKLPIVR